MRRRNLIQGMLALPVLGPNLLAVARASDDGWHAGEVAHILPTASHERIQLKCSLRAPLDAAAVLVVDDRRVPGRRTDAAGRFFAFDVPGLAADREYRLQLTDPSGRPLCDAWPLRTFPAPDASARHVRILKFTCAGGHPLMARNGVPTFLPLELRQRLLRRALSFAPHAVIANGDHVYWDQLTWLESESPALREMVTALYEQVGMLDRHDTAHSAANERALLAAVEPQIGALYGVLLRSTPGFFLNDDHDYFENDEARPDLVTLPPYRYQVDFARRVRDLFLPEFLPDPNRPLALSGTGAADRPVGVSESFGTLRWGRLLEACLYDCGRFLSLKGTAAGLVPPEVERWLGARTRDPDVAHLIHVPSHPMGWTAGKWREWYPDVGVDDATPGASTVAQMHAAGQRFRLTTDRPKYLWQSGWWQQHQRLLEMLTGQPRRSAIVCSGDLHASGHGRILRSGPLSLADNPVHTILAGTPGTGTGWPSAVRGTAPMPPHGMELDPVTPVVEKNGFTLLDVTAETVRVRLFAWRAGEASPEAIDNLEPYHDVEIGRGR